MEMRPNPKTLKSKQLTPLELRQQRTLILRKQKIENSLLSKRLVNYKPKSNKEIEVDLTSLQWSHWDNEIKSFYTTENEDQKCLVLISLLTSSKDANAIKFSIKQWNNYMSSIKALDFSNQYHKIQTMFNDKFFLYLLDYLTLPNNELTIQYELSNWIFSIATTSTIYHKYLLDRWPQIYSLWLCTDNIIVKNNILLISGYAIRYALPLNIQLVLNSCPNIINYLSMSLIHNTDEDYAFNLIWIYGDIFTVKDNNTFVFELFNKNNENSHVISVLPSWLKYLSTNINTRLFKEAVKTLNKIIAAWVDFDSWVNNEVFIKQFNKVIEWDLICHLLLFGNNEIKKTDVKGNIVSIPSMKTFEKIFEILNNLVYLSDDYIEEMVDADIVTLAERCLERMIVMKDTKQNTNLIISLLEWMENISVSSTSFCLTFFRKNRLIKYLRDLFYAVYGSEIKKIIISVFTNLMNNKINSARLKTELLIEKIPEWFNDGLNDKGWNYDSILKCVESLVMFIEFGKEWKDDRNIILEELENGGLKENLERLAYNPNIDTNLELESNTILFFIEYLF